MARKRMTLEQVERMQDKAVRFLRDVVGDADRADDFEAMSPQEYAEHKGVEIAEANPGRSTWVAPGREDMTKRQLEERVAELEEHNEDLQSRLDSIVDIVQPEDDDDDDEDEEDDDADGEDDDD